MYEHASKNKDEIGRSRCLSSRKQRCRLRRYPVSSKCHSTRLTAILPEIASLFGMSAAYIPAALNLKSAACVFSISIRDCFIVIHHRYPANPPSLRIAHEITVVLPARYAWFYPDWQKRGVCHQGTRPVSRQCWCGSCRVKIFCLFAHPIFE